VHCMELSPNKATCRFAYLQFNMVSLCTGCACQWCKMSRGIMTEVESDGSNYWPEYVRLEGATEEIEEI
jgi:hypothetical protein